MKRLMICLLLCSPAAIAGCSGRLYNLETGQVTQLKCGHKHTVSGTLPDGEKLSGEYVTVINGAVGWGSIYGGAFSSSSTTVAAGGKNRGSVIMTGDKGSIVTCEYMTGMGGHGDGACEEKHGSKYKLMF